MSEKMRIDWYKTPLSKQDLKSLSRRRNLPGMLQTIGYIMLLFLSGFLAYWSTGHLGIASIVLLFLLHGVLYSFMLNGFHELSHNTVFKSKRLNLFFYRLFSFLSWNNHVFFSESHKVHHLYTLHRELDGEVSLPVRVSAGDFFLRGIINPLGLIETLYGTVLLALGVVRGKMYSGLGSFSSQWKARLFPEHKAAERRKLCNWARVTLAGHLVILILCLVTGRWIIFLLLSLAPFYGAGFLYFLNPTQHIGMSGDVADFRLNSRTILLNPVLRFLYWNMNYHVEHHMYAAVPFFNLGKLHRLIGPDLPESPRGLIRTWIQIKKNES